MGQRQVEAMRGALTTLRLVNQLLLSQSWSLELGLN